MARRRSKRKHFGGLAPIAVVVVLFCGWWWLYRGDAWSSAELPAVPLAATSVQATDSPGPVQSAVAEAQPAFFLQTGAKKANDSSLQAAEPSNEPSALTPSQSPIETVEAPRPQIPALLAAGRRALEQDDPVEARARFTEALILGPQEADRSFLHSELERIAADTIFSPRICENDPMVARYVLQPGDTLAKIATEYKVTTDLLAEVNRIADKHLIRAGQTIKAVRGPFHAVVDRKAYTVDVFLGPTFVKQFRVGLGADDSTPKGKWQVASKLVNPTYYPPRGGSIIAADDLQNPLGERWIGLVGIEGGAVGQERYGIHGTIEPESIGQNTSMGCIRMHNADVEQLYSYLVEKHSVVTVR